MSDESINGKLQAAQAAGAHDEFVAFVAEYPESKAADTLETAISLDALDEFESIAGSALGSLWRDGAPAVGNPDEQFQERIMELFPEDRWPTWVRQKHADTEAEA